MKHVPELSLEYHSEDLKLLVYKVFPFSTDFTEELQNLKDNNMQEKTNTIKYRKVGDRSSFITTNLEVSTLSTMKNSPSFETVDSRRQ